MAGTDIQVAFPEKSGGEVFNAPPLPVAPAQQGLEEVFAQPVAEAKKQLSCKAILVGDSLPQAEGDATKAYPDLRDNPAALMAFGSNCFDGINDLGRRLMHGVKPGDIPGAEALVKDLNSRMRGVRSHYDVSDADVLARYNKWKSGLGGIFHRAKTMLQVFLDDVTTIETQLDRVERQLNSSERQLEQNICYYNELYRENEEGIKNVIYTIAVMEMVRDLAAADVSAIVPGDSSLGDRQGERKAALAQFVNSMDVKIGDFKGRLMLAWSDAPRIRNMRGVDVQVAQQLNSLVTLWLPSMRNVVAQWAMRLQALDAAKFGQVVKDSTNEWIEAGAQDEATVVPMLAATGQTPTLSLQAITALATSIDQQADGIVAAMKAGQQQREQLEQGIMSARQVIDNASGKISDAQIQQVLDSARQPIQIASAVNSAGQASS